ncbi:MAG TPA: hypothetical protein VLB80_00380 [Candidatus Babeliales bacterium]|nr:hypothetical protein [Candidatus Babeliales bacterium]
MNNLLMCLLFFFISCDVQCMLKNIKSTDTILSNDYKHLSLAHGAIFCVSGLIGGLYDRGNIHPIYGIDKQGRNIIENYKQIDSIDHTVRLVHTFFYRIPGFEGEAEPKATEQLEYHDPVVIAQKIAHTLALCHSVSTDYHIFKNAINTLATHKNLQELAPKLIKNPLYLTKKNHLAWKTFIGQVSLHKKKNQINYSQQIAHVITVTRICKNLAYIHGVLDGLLKYQAKLGAHMGTIVFNSLAECNPQNTDALYPQHMTQMILLAFMYKKYSNNRSILKIFYDELNNHLDKKVLISDLNDIWVKDEFKQVTQPQAFGILAKIFSSNNLASTIQQKFAELVYCSQQTQGFPTPIGHSFVVYEYKSGKEIRLLDCGETPIRNFINLYAYDAEQNKFTHERLKENIDGNNVHPFLIEYLTLFDDVNMASSPEAHSTWIKVVSNIPYATYVKAIDDTMGSYKNIGLLANGLIAIPGNEQNQELLHWLAEHKYTILEKTEYGYELLPSIKNVIIVLNHIFGLNLFDDEGDLEKEFTRFDFIDYYFSKLCTKLHATGFLAATKLPDKKSEEKNFNNLDSTSTKLYATMHLAGFTCQFVTSFSHGEFKVIVKPPSEELAPLFEKLFDQSSLSFLATKVTNQLDHIKNNSEFLYSNLFVLNGENTAELPDILQKISECAHSQMPFSHKIAMKNFLLRLAKKQPKEERELAKCDILRLFVKIIDNEERERSCATITSIIDKASHATASLDQRTHLSGLELFTLLVENDFKQSFKKALQAVVDSMMPSKTYLQIEHINLLNALFEKNYTPAFAKSLEIALTASSSTDQSIQFGVIKLFKILVEMNYTPAFRDASNAIMYGTLSLNSEINDITIDLVKLLIKQNYPQVFEHALQAARQAILSSNSIIHDTGIKIFELLIENDYQLSFEYIAQVAEDMIKSSNDYIQLSGIMLCTTLVKKNYARIAEKSLEYAEKAIIASNIRVQLLGIGLFMALVKNNYKPACEKILHITQKIEIDLKSSMIRHRWAKLLHMITERDSYNCL